jgi:FtsP/CotA-like multicopper oxidase with cupredoxin domain
MDQLQKTRRGFLAETALGTGLLWTGCNRTVAPSNAKPMNGPADVTLRIGPVLVDIAQDHTISTVGYNGSVPGPLIRLREGVPVTVDLFNETDTPELIHWRRGGKEPLCSGPWETAL